MDLYEGSTSKFSDNGHSKRILADRITSDFHMPPIMTLSEYKDGLEL